MKNYQENVQEQRGDFEKQLVIAPGPGGTCTGGSILDFIKIGYSLNALKQEFNSDLRGEFAKGFAMVNRPLPIDYWLLDYVKKILIPYFRQEEVSGEVVHQFLKDKNVPIDIDDDPNDEPQALVGIVTAFLVGALVALLVDKYDGVDD